MLRIEHLGWVYPTQEDMNPVNRWMRHVTVRFRKSIKTDREHLLQGRLPKNTSFGIQDVHLCVEQGECVVLFGASGCGKTTLLKLIAGLLRPQQGSIFVAGKNITQMPAHARGMGMVFQQPLLFPHMSVIDNVAFPLRMRGIGKRERWAQASQWLHAVDLQSYATQMPHRLSGGQQQRVALARAFIAQPAVLLMDEPFSALDPVLRERMRELFKTLQREHRTTTLFVTHDRDEAFSLADRMVTMAYGGIEQIGTPEELYEHPTALRTAQLLGSVNVFSCDEEQGNVPHHWVIRPEQVTVRPCTETPPPHRTIAPPQTKQPPFSVQYGTVIDVRRREGHVRYVVQCGHVRVEGTGIQGETIQRAQTVEIRAERHHWHCMPTSTQPSAPHKTNGSEPPC